MEKTLGGLTLALAFHVALLVWAANYSTEKPQDIPEGEITVEIAHEGLSGSAGHNEPPPPASNTENESAQPGVALPSAEPKSAEPIVTNLATPMPSRGEMVATQSAPPKPKPAQPKAKAPKAAKDKVTPPSLMNDDESSPVDVRDLHEEFLQDRADVALAPIPEPYMTDSLATEKAGETLPAEADSTAEEAESGTHLAAVAAPAMSAGVATAPPTVPAPAATTPPAGAGTGMAGSGPSLVQGTGPSGPIRDDLNLRQQPGNQPPLYPTQDRLQRRTGQIVFRYLVKNDGSVANILIEKGTGFKSLDLEALKAMKKWRYVPGQEGWARKAFQFSLNGEVQTMPARLGQSSTANQHAEAVH